MLTVDFTDVLSIKNELVVYVSDAVAAIPTLKQHQFTLSTLDDEIIDIAIVITAIKKFLDSIGEGNNFAVISNNDSINIKSISGTAIERTTTTTTQQGMFSCTHCGFVTRYEVELNAHMRIHYL